MAVIPEAYRPPVVQPFIVMANAGGSQYARGVIDRSTGEIIVYGPDSTWDWISMSISYLK